MCHHSKGMLRREFDELRLSWHVRMRFSERQIIAIYSNRGYYEPGITGIERASKEFFGKEP